MAGYTRINAGTKLSATLSMEIILDGICISQNLYCIRLELISWPVKKGGKQKIFLFKKLIFHRCEER